MSELTSLSIAESRVLLRARSVSARELTQAHLGAMTAARGLNMFITETPELALEMADRADLSLAQGTAGALAGIPIAVKDLFCTRGTLTTAASHILEGFTPTYEAAVTANLWRDGAVMLGKTNLDEFAMGSSNETSYYGPVINPWRARNSNNPVVPGGSSGGSAAAVAARVAAGAVGTDTGGSIRQPAAFCGVVGLKPTYGRCSRWGTIAFASSLDQAGPMARNVRDVAILLGSMAGFDPRDSTSLDIAVPDYEAALKDDVKGLRIGIPKEYALEGNRGEMRALWEAGAGWLRDAGAEIIEISLAHTKYALPAYYIIAPAEASSNLARYDGARYGLREDGENLIDMYEKTRAAGFGTEVRRRILIGTYALSAGYYDAYYLKAQKVRALIARDFQEAFERVDCILTPTTPGAPFAQGEKSADPVAMYLNDVYTGPSSLAGLPGLSVPAGLSETGLPLGLQVLGPHFGEETVLRVGRIIEQAAGFEGLPEPWWESP